MTTAQWIVGLTAAAMWATCGYSAMQSDAPGDGGFGAAIAVLFTGAIALGLSAAWLVMMMIW